MTNKTLFERIRDAGIPAWTYPYGAPDRVFEINTHTGYEVAGKYKGKVVRAVDLFQGVLCRIVSPDHERLVEIRKEYADGVKASHISAASVHENIAALMERLQQELAPIGKYRILLGSNGSTINDQGIKIARTFLEGGVPVYLTNAYHGNNIFQNAICDANKWTGKHVKSLANIGYRCGALIENDGSFRELFHVNNDMREIEQVVNGLCKESKAKPIFMFEDIQGVGTGFGNPGEEFLRKASELVHDAGGLTFNDIVQTMFRRGEIMSPIYWMNDTVKYIAPNELGSTEQREKFSVENHRAGEKQYKKQAPDFITSAKAFANGESLAFLAVREDIALAVNIPDYGMHWDTFAHNAMYTEIALEVLNIYRDEKLGDNIVARSEELWSGVRKIQEDYPQIIKHLQGHRFMLGIVLPSAAYGLEAVASAPEFGIYIGKGGRDGNVLRIAPLADITEEGIKEAVDGLRRMTKYLAEEFKPPQ